MKKFFIAGLFAGLLGGFFVGNIAAVSPHIEIENNQGIVVGIYQSENAYVVDVQCECWHGVRKTSFRLHTTKNYQVGDMVRFE